MTVNLRFVGGAPPQPASAVRLLFGGAPHPPPVIPRGITVLLAASRWQGATAITPALVASGWARVTNVVTQATQTAWLGRIAAIQALTRTWWNQATPLVALTRTWWNQATPLSLLRASGWGQAQMLSGVATQVAWGGHNPMWSYVDSAWAAGYWVSHIAQNPYRGHTLSGLTLRSPWGPGHHLVSFGSPWSPYVPPPPDPVVPCRAQLPPLAVDLRFWRPGVAASPSAVALRFRCFDIRTAIVPVKEVYMIVNSVSLVRVSDGMVIPCPSLSLSLDVDSWVWSFSATLPASALPLIEPVGFGEPVELLAGINGTTVWLLVESISRDRTFGKEYLRVGGRGRAATLDAPYYPLTTYDNASGARTSQQLIDAAMPVGWSVDWGLTAWLVPAGVWSHQGTAISAANAIAAAGGGYVQAHSTNKVLRVLPRYPSGPWDWGSVTPDVVLPSAATLREGIEWVDKPLYNRVFVSGQGQGVLGQVTRFGTAGDVVAQMVTDALITHADAARQRAMPVLSDTGRQARVTLRTPVFAVTGIILPGTFVQYVDGATTRIGLSRSVSVDVGMPEVWQSITVETHE